ncbi:MAG: nucleotidyltransferase [Prevotellaceae bacterium]|nr:nucleotidyltransferase [Prevotellaceae bacterium]
MGRILSKEQKEEFKDILETLGESLDITQTQYDNLTRSYKAVGEFLQNDPVFEQYKPIVSPQGSLRLGTIIQPINPNDDLDVDLVYRLTEKDPRWTQKDLKEKVGARLKGSDRYASMIEKKEGRRCWTLLYRDNSDNPQEKYHMDILPSVADGKYTERMIRLFSESFSAQTVDQISIRITDKEAKDYATSTRQEEWLKSNPDGYALWFANRCKADESVKLMAEAIVPIEKYNKEKTVLQRIVQILKRHRDMMFRYDKDDKPISIIITTLAARAYKGEKDLLEGLVNVVDNLEKSITKNEKGEDVVSNPVNHEENFADKWPTHPRRRENFYQWLAAVKKDVYEIFDGANKIQIQNTMGRIFGKDMITKASSLLVERRKSKLATGATLLTSTRKVTASTVGRIVNTANTFYGK